MTRYPRVVHSIGGEAVDSPGPALSVVSPVDGELLAELAVAGPPEINAAVQAAERASSHWSRRTLKERSQVFYRYRSLLERHAGELAQLIHEENGKTIGEARAEIAKAIEVTEFACSLPQLLTGEVSEVSPGVECRVEHAPLGVVCSITPFNFPSMVPHWTIPIALCLGNAMILKPSEKVPLSAQRIATLLAEAGLPPGVFNVVHGGSAVVMALCDHPRIAALSFVGSTPVARQVYARACSNLKRALALGGAKNHLVVLPDADVESAAENILASMSGCAGQRCMAASALLAVGTVEPVIERLCEATRKLVVGQDVGAVISAEARQRIETAIDEAEAEGAKVLVDGRHAVVPGRERGFYVGPTVLDHVRPDMRIAQEEIFGPVLAIIRVPDLDTALSIENASPYGNAAAVYTRSGQFARRFAAAAEAGMIGINVGVPVPREPFGFGGWHHSRFGAGDITGKSSIGFWTQSKKITSRW